jgi:hypothetical protein
VQGKGLRVPGNTCKPVADDIVAVVAVMQMALVEEYRVPESESRGN